MRGERKRERERGRDTERTERGSKRKGYVRGGHGGAGRGRNAISTYYQATQYVPSESAAHNEESRSLLPQMHSTEFLVAPPDSQSGTATASGSSVIMKKSQHFIFFLLIFKLALLLFLLYFFNKNFWSGETTRSRYLVGMNGNESFSI